MAINRFIPEDYYSSGIDYSILSDQHNEMTSFKIEGMKLIDQYYARKYNTQITILPLEMNVEDQFNGASNTILEKLRANREKQNDRQVFILHQNSNRQYAHATLIAYIRENAEDAILYADTRGVDEKRVLQLKNSTKLPVYAVKEIRQVDGYSCYADAFVMAKDITGKDVKNSYLLPDLLFKLKERCVKENDYYNVKLPNELLKTAQISKFLTLHINATRANDKIHKDFTLSQFREKYIIKDLKFYSYTAREIVTKDVSGYLRLKGNKYANMIQIQYYINELKNINPLLTADSELIFFQIAKNILSSADNKENNNLALYQFTELFSKILLNNTSTLDIKKLLPYLNAALNAGCFRSLIGLCKDKIDSMDIHTYALESNNENLMKELLELNIISVPTSYDDYDSNELMYAILCDSEMGVRVLLENGADPNLLNSEHESPLYCAISSCRNPAVIQSLLLHGADPNLQDNKGNTSLHRAVTQNIIFANQLLNYPKIDPSIKNHNGETASDLIMMNKTGPYQDAIKRMQLIVSSNPLHRASLFQSEVKNKEKTSSKTHESNPLHQSRLTNK